MQSNNGDNAPTIRTKDYAELAYPLVAGIKENKALQKDYRTQALNLPTMILQSGLAQSVGFLMAKGENHHITLLNHLTIVLGYASIDDKDNSEKLKEKREILHKDILKKGITDYQVLTRNAIEASSWLKRYTQALLAKENNNAVNA